MTLSASGTVTLTIDNSIRFANSAPSSGDVLTYNGTAYAPATPASGVTGSGSSNRLAYWNGASSITSSANMTADGSSVGLSANFACGTVSAFASTRLSIKASGTGAGSYALQIKDSANTSIFTIQDNGTVAADTGAFVCQGDQVVTARRSGYTNMTGTANRATVYDTSTVTLIQLATRVKAIQDDLMTNHHGLFGA
jgi:hypothetical protein